MSSFGKAKRGTSLNKSQLMPGPGNYSAQARGSTPSYSIGRGGRSSSKPNNGPGPGQYQTINGSNRGVSIGQRTKYGSVMGNLGKEGSNPGPGHYAQTFNDGSRSAAYTFGVKIGSALDNKNAGGPGPGQYNPGSGGADNLGKSAHNSSRGPGFGTEKRAIGGVTKSATEIPGPGQYTIDSWGTHAPRIGFGTSTRGKDGLGNKQSKLVPGPGQYNCEEIIGKNAAKVSMKFRPNTASTSRTLDIPGPGQYNPNLTSVKTAIPGSRIGTSQRSGLSFKDQNLPGPGHFSLGDEWANKKKNAGFGSSSRGGLSMSRDNIPGPGNYNPTERNVASAAPQYSMGTGGRSKGGMGGKTAQPGPGQYNPKVDYAKENIGSGVKIGTSPRGTKYGINQVPGPGNYNLNDRLGGPAYGIGSSNRSKAKHEQTPGPGHYKLPVYVANLPRYQMPDKPESLRYV